MGKRMVILDPRIGSRTEVLQLVGCGKYRSALVHVLALMWVTENATDGVFPARALRFVHGRRRDAEELVAVGLWHEITRDEWGIYEWAENQIRRPRVAIPKAVRSAVFIRDGCTCLQCGSMDRLTIDHIVAWANGGSNDMDNLQTLCLSCNSRKRDK